MRWQKVPRQVAGSLIIGMLLGACTAMQPSEPADNSEQGWVRRGHEDSGRQVYPQWPEDW